MSNRPNVLRVNAVEETERYRTDVAQILLNIQSDNRVTLLDIAEATDISLGTISNAANKKADLNSVYLRRLASVYGSHVLDPYVGRVGGRVVPKDPEAANDHQTASMLSLFVAKLVDALKDGKRDHRETCDLADFAPELIRSLEAIVTEAARIKGKAA